MPTGFVKKMAKKHKMSVDKSEKLWDRAKEIADKQGKGDNFAFITGIYKNMLSESFVKYIEIIT